MPRGSEKIAKRLLHLDSTRGKSAETPARTKLWAIISTLGESADYYISYSDDGGIRLSLKINPDGKLD